MQHPTRPNPIQPNPPRVWGIGQSTAERWYQQGCRTLDDLRQLPSLTEVQQVGLKYFDDFEV